MLKHLSLRNKNIHSQRNLYRNVHSSFIFSSSKLEMTQMSIREWLNKGTLQSNKKKQTTDAHNNLNRFQRTYTEWKKNLICLNNILEMLECYREEEQISDCQVMGVGWREQVAWEIFVVMEQFCFWIMVITQIYVCGKTPQKYPHIQMSAYKTGHNWIKL